MFEPGGAGKSQVIQSNKDAELVIIYVLKNFIATLATLLAMKLGFKLEQHHFNMNLQMLF